MEKRRPKNRLSTISAALVLSLAGCTYSPTDAQQPQNRVAATSGSAVAGTPHPTLGKAAGEVMPFEYTGGDLRAALLAHPAPEVWLIFPGSADRGERQNDSGNIPAVTVGLPPDAKEVLSSYWRYLLSVRHDTDLAEMINTKNSTQQELQKIQLDLPSGRRVIARDEAKELVDFIAKSEMDIMEQANKYRK